MCKILTEGTAKNCPGKCSPLCKHGRQIEPEPIHLQMLLNSDIVLINSIVPAVSDYEIVNNSFDEKEGYHI